MTPRQPRLGDVDMRATDRPAYPEPWAATLRELLPHDLADDAEAPRLGDDERVGLHRRQAPQEQHGMVGERRQRVAQQLGGRQHPEVASPQLLWNLYAILVCISDATGNACYKRFGTVNS
jgi:hypothetical protein